MEYAGLSMVEHDGIWYFEDIALASAYFEQYLVRIDDKKEGRRRHLLESTERRRKNDAFMKTHDLVRKDLRMWQLRLVANPNFRPGRYGYDMYSKHEDDATKWFDHDALFWNKANQRYVLTTQPYDVSLEKFKMLEQYCSDRAIRLTISYTDAWHYPGRCPLIVLCGKSKKWR
jgi:hypothetical protein